VSYACAARRALPNQLVIIYMSAHSVNRRQRQTEHKAHWNCVAPCTAYVLLCSLPMRCVHW
jgi:hypothetical protein